MASQSNPSFQGSESTSTGKALVRANDQSQLDFEIDFFGRILEQHTDYVDVLRIQGNNLTLKGRYADGLELDKRLIQLRPHDALAHYNLACSYALLKKPDLALKTLPPKQRGAVVLRYYAGYSIKETAAILDSTPAAVGVHLTRGRRRLRTLLEERDD